MAIVKPFKGFRPKKELVAQIASRPYDVLNSEEAKIEAEGNPLSFLHVVKPEIDLPEDVDHYSSAVYNKGKENLRKLITDGVFFQDVEPTYYIYAQTMWGKTQYGLVGCAAVSDYLNNIIKKHELTRPDKEEDRMNHVRVTNFNAEPVFFAYPDNTKIDSIVNNYIANSPEYKFETSDGVGHQLWIISDKNHVETIEHIFNTEVKYTYVADGHHRTAAAALVGQERAKNNPSHTGNEEYNFFMAVHFPASQLRIIDYNRLVKDLNNLSKEELITRIEKNFKVENKGANEYKPKELHEMAMYLNGEWYSLKANTDTYDDNDPIGVLDVTILSKTILDPIFDIKDLRKSKRIDFVGGIRGLGELKKRVDSGEMKVAFALYPVSMKQLIDIADTNNIMPPKTTWFEPKLRSGLVTHSLD
ncbi:MAG: DUF1015 domain-containing protein [Bacteroidales bacterium]|nr:DUF1015 domain-containing protein [Bacteroidales bacterium]MBN2818320.1 DUF1015 domain-containing protein [Bacteroidales bacterium]